MKKLFYYIKFTLILRQVIKNEEFVEKLSKTLGVQFKYDWIYRIYAVVNPLIENINSAGNSLVYSEGKPLVERWLMDNLNIIREIINTNNLFDILTYDIKRLDNDENYLIRIYPIYFKETKRFLIVLSIVIILAILGLLILL